MSSDQLKDEKLAVQKALLQYENIHGRPVCYLPVYSTCPYILLSVFNFKRGHIHWQSLDTEKFCV